MFRALLYLRLMSFRNWTLTRLRRLRQPKYLFGAIAGFAYFYFFFFRTLGTDPSQRQGRLASPEAREAFELAQASLPLDWLPATTAFGALALLCLVTLMWVLPRQRAALGFSEAEVAFLFPAPIPRRTLVHFRLLTSQVRSIVGATLMMLFSNRWAMVGGNAFTHAVGWWFVFSALNLHFSGASFTLTRWADAGARLWQRRLLGLALVGGVIAVAMNRLPDNRRWPVAANALDLRPLSEWVVSVTNSVPLSWLLWPVEVVLAPFLALTPRDFLWALPAALTVLLLHYLWVVRTTVAFEDATLDQAEKRTARINSWRTGEGPLSAPTKGRAAPFLLAGTGRPEVAFLWKNLLSAWPYFRVRVLIGCALAILVIGGWFRMQPAASAMLPGLGGIVLMFAAYTLIVGPQFARQDIRSDLSHADLLKTYPLPGWKIVLGELLAPTAILTGILWLAILMLAVALAPGEGGPSWLTPTVHAGGALALAFITPALVTLQLLVPNAAALVFPAWFQTSRTRGGGPEVIGQRMIFFFAQLIVMLVVLVPAGFMAAGLIFILQWLIGPLAAISIATLAVLVVLIGEIWCGVWWLGTRFEAFDLSSDLRAQL